MQDQTRTRVKFSMGSLERLDGERHWTGPNGPVHASRNSTISFPRRRRQLSGLSHILCNDKFRVPVYFLFTIGLASACYLRPIAGDFDRYIYESLVRARSQSLTEIYLIVKHESPRAEASSILDSPLHLGELLPLYAIRPLYIQTVSIINDAGMPIQPSISLVSAISLFVMAWLLALRTGNYLGSALMILTPGMVEIGRSGGPDALSSLFVIFGCFLVLSNKLLTGILLLLVSVWVRTDNVLVVIAMLAWLWHEGKLRLPYAVTLSVVASASVAWINFWSGNYGLKVLFYCSFISGRAPAEVVPRISAADYAHIFLSSVQSVAPQLALWVLLGLAAWQMGARYRTVLLPILFACIIHFLLFPSPEARYFAWAFPICGALFIQAMTSSRERHLSLTSDRIAAAV